MKSVLGVIIIVLVLGVGGFFLMRKNTPETPLVAVSENAKGNEGKIVQEPAPSLVSSLKDAIGLGQKMQCTYTIKNKDMVATSRASIDGQKFRSETEMNGMKMFMLSDGETQYMWNSASQQGFKMDKACLESLKSSVPESAQGTGNPTPQAGDYQATLDTATNVSCEPTTSVDFSLPMEVSFVDQCAMMEQGKKMMEQFKGQLPSGTYPGQ